MKSCLVVCVLLVATVVFGHGLPLMPRPAVAGLVTTGLSSTDNSASDAGADTAKLCEQVSFSRNLRYGEAGQNTLDVATPSAKAPTSRPVLLFVAGESFTGDGATADAARELQDQAMCFAARNGMVGVRMSYRLAPAAQWPSGARDVAAALSWIHQNIDLFNGNPQEIVAIGYAAGAFHVASLFAHPELQAQDSDVAGIVLVSGIYRPGPDASDSVKAYLGTDASQYDKRSALPGILGVAEPIVLAWAADDAGPLVAQGETLKAKLCAAGHCPRTTVLKDREGLGSVFDASRGGLAESTLLLVRQLEARGLP